jgi:dolichol kinase
VAKAAARSQGTLKVVPQKDFHGALMDPEEPPASPNLRSTAAVPLLRKGIHLAMTVVPAVGWLVSYEWALALAVLVLVASLALEASRRWWSWVNGLLWHLIPSVFRTWEDQHVLGSTWMAIGMLATLLLCGQDAGGTALLFLIWGDPAAELVGRRFGQPGRPKTAAGSAGCLAACLLASAISLLVTDLNTWAVLSGAGVATAVERWSPLPDDNLWIPILSGLTILLFQHLVGG